MDIFSKISMEHGQVYESLTVFRKMVDIDNNQASFMKMREFFHSLIEPHFKFEEGKIFPIMLTHGTAEEKSVTNELLKEHLAIMAAFGKFSAAFDLIAQNGFEGNAQLKGMTAEIAKLLMDHTHKEDNSFYPNLKKYLFRT
jgi:hemerythrin-like domain-containing protein